MSYNPSTNRYSPDTNNHPTYEPNGTIKIYHDVPLDSSYVHSYNSAVWNTPFATAINSYLKYTLAPQGLSGGQSYSRMTEGSVRVEIFKGDLISCNYMQITNGINGENFPYWCFITDVEYVNNTTSDIYFEIDYLQTYWDRFTIPANFIVREHIPVSEDVIGASIVPENLGLGDLIVHHSYWRTIGQSDNMYTVVMYVPNTTASEPYIFYVNGECRATSQLTQAQWDEQKMPTRRNKMGTGFFCLPIPSGFGSAVQDAVNRLNENSGTIVAIFQIPFEMYSDNWSSTTVSEHEQTFTQQTDFKYVSKSGSYSNVRNKKLYSYPFRELVVSNQNGTNAELKWELFSERANNQVVAKFNIINAFVPSPKSFIYPKNYRNVTKDYDNGITLEDFPQPCYTEDNFSKWWAQNKSSLGISLLSQIGSAGLMFATAGGSAAAGFGAEMAGVFADEGAVALENMAMANSLGMSNVGRGFGNMASTFFQAEEMAKSGGGKKGLSRGQGLALSTGALGIAKTLGGVMSARAIPNSAQTQNNSAIVNVLLDRFGFVLYDIGITGEMAEIFDKYFDMFGYATNRVKVPNFLASATKRPSYNYVKMQNCYIKAQTGDRGLPEKAQSAIQAIFNNGITFWTNFSDVGNYNVTNR